MLAICAEFKSRRVCETPCCLRKGCYEVLNEPDVFPRPATIGPVLAKPLSRTNSKPNTDRPNWVKWITGLLTGVRTGGCGVP